MGASWAPGRTSLQVGHVHAVQDQAGGVATRRVWASVQRTRCGTACLLGVGNRPGKRARAYRRGLRAAARRLPHLWA